VNKFGAELILRAEICLLTAGWPIPRSFATAEKLLFNSSNEYLHGIEFVHSSLLFLDGMDSMRGIAILPLIVRCKE